MGNTKPNPAIARHNNFGVEISLNGETSCEDCKRVQCVNLCVPFTSTCRDFCLGEDGCFTIPWTGNQICSPLFDCTGGNVRNNKLTSGYYGGQTISKPIGEGFTKCSHGGFLDSTSDIPAIGGINKDTDFSPVSPHHWLHRQAADVAKDATVELLRDMWDLVGDEHFGRFLGLLGTLGSLVIVMDTTGSMSEEIAAARESAKLLVDEMVDLEDPPTNFVLSPFNDPSVGPITVIINYNIPLIQFFFIAFKLKPI